VSYTSYSIGIDRENATFSFNVDYTIDAYVDPETGEYFGDTYWTLYYGGFTWGNSGYSGESGYANLSIGLQTGEDVVESRIDFTAYNTFSGAALYQQWNVLEAAYATGDKTMLGGADTDIIISGSGDDVLSGLGGNDYLDAGAGADILNGGAGADYLDGGAGNDLMTGGADNDLYVVASAGDAIVEEAGGGLDLVFAWTTYTLPNEVEQLSIVGYGELDATGNAGANRLDGNDSANVLRGLGGDDLLNGSGGNDTLIGGAGNDWLDGGPGADRLEGGTGDDTYEAYSLDDQIVELAGQGVDIVRVSSIPAYTLGANVENMLLIGNADFEGTGNGLANLMTGAGGRDTLRGLGGADTLQGGLGDDTLIGGAGGDVLQGGEGSDWANYAGATSGVSVNLATGAGTRGEALGDTFQSIENILGTALNDVLVGDANDNRLVGGAGADRLVGGGGHDWLTGGTGADVLVGNGDDGVSYAGSAGAVKVDLHTQHVRGGDATGDIISDFADAAGGNGDDILTGNDAANWLFGDAGADRIDGRAGNDTIEGGAGADRLTGGKGLDLLSYASSAGAVSVDLASGAGTGADANGDVFSGFEGLLGSAFADHLNGDKTANQLIGGAGDDVINGRGGNDTIDGGDGADIMDGGAGIDTLSFTSTDATVWVSLQNSSSYSNDGYYDQFTGFENLRGSEHGDSLSGNEGDNAIDGGGGGDYIYGYGGADTLTGGAGDDVYFYTYGYGQDTITDFQAGTGSDDWIYVEFGQAFDTFEEVMGAAVQVGDDVVITFDADTSLTLLGVDRDALVATDFFFFPY